MSESTRPADTSTDGGRIDMKRAAMQHAQDALFVAREFTELYDTEHAAWVNEKCHEAIAALRAALAEQKCSCGDRPADHCPGEWEPGCDLGANEKYAKVATADASLGAAIEAIDAALAEQAQPMSWNFRSFDDWWDQHGFFNAVAADQVNSRPLAKLAWEVSREMSCPPAPIVPQPLTDEDIHLITGHCGVSKHAAISIARAVEAEVLERMGVQR